jgi:hypothetical protein
VVIRFSASMSPATFENRVSILPSVPFLMHWSSGDLDELVLKPIQRLRAGTTYVVTLKEGFSSRWGQIGPERVIRFKTFPMTVIALQPFDGEINVAPDAPVRVTFNTPVDLSVLAEAILFEPLLDSVRVVPDNEDATRVTVEHSPFAAQTMYRLSISEEATDRYGSPMRTPVITVFSTKK